MKYDFTSIIDRRGKDATAVEGIGPNRRWGNEPDAPQEGFDFIPMWVADMNFATCPTVTNAIIERAQHPLFGYYIPREEFFQNIIDWRTRRGMVGLKQEHIGYQNGVHGCVTSCIEVLTQPGDSVLIHSPYYIGFDSDIDYLGRNPVYTELKQDENGVWRMDYEDMDRKLKQFHIHTAVFCSPHNPCGRVWEQWELEKAMEVYEANDCYVISDEIWADLVFTGSQHIPTAMVSDWAKEHTISIYAPSKTFNLAGLHGSYSIIFSKYLRDRICGYAGKTHYNSMNVLSMHAMIGAYSQESEEWVSELCQVLEENCRYACDFINEKIDGVSVTMPQGTYMIFLDCTEYCERTGVSLDDVLTTGWSVGVGWQDGRRFRGPCHIRMNLASPNSRIREACDRLMEYVFNK